MDAINFKFSCRKGILYKTYFGSISLGDIITSWLEVINSDILTEKLHGFVLDYRKAHFDFHHSRHVEIADFYRQHPTVFEGKRIAYVTSSPDDIVFPILIQIQDDGYESMPFSTIEAAVEWVCDTMPVLKF